MPDPKLDAAVEDGWHLLDLAVLNKNTEKFEKAKMTLEAAIAARACAPLVEALKRIYELSPDMPWGIYDRVDALYHAALAAHRERTR